MNEAYGKEAFVRKALASFSLTLLSAPEDPHPVLLPEGEGTPIDVAE